MAPETQGAVRAAQAWLKTSWHVQVPYAWLEACVEWLQEEGGGRLSQQQINQQVLDQWLLADLKVLGHGVLPDGLSQAHKTELNGTFCVQVDSLLDISQPAYGQLQKWRGKDCTNEDVSEVTQITQKPWEAKTTRMLVLQVTDGVQSLEAMEYKPIPALSTALRPGVKLQLKGQMVCRLGMLLLGPGNVEVLGGEVEDMADRNSQGKVLCRALGLPEEEPQIVAEQQHQEAEEIPAEPDQSNQEMDDLDVDDQELLASLEAQEERGGAPRRPIVESGYGTLSEASAVSSVRSHPSTASSRTGLTQSNRSGSIQSHHWLNDQGDSALVTPISSTSPTHHRRTDQDMADEYFPDEDFDDLPLDELDSVIFQQSADSIPQPDSSHRSNSNSSSSITTHPNSFDRATTPPTDRFDRTSQQQTQNRCGLQLGVGNSRFTKKDKERHSQSSGREARGQQEAKNSKLFSLQPAHGGTHIAIDNEEDDFMDEDMDSCFLDVKESNTVQSKFESAQNTAQGIDRVSTTEREANLSTALTLTSPPFSYLCLLQDGIATPRTQATEIRVKAFIVTLLGKLTSNSGQWQICVTISDGTGYLDVELSNKVLVGLLGFTVAEKGSLKRDPTRRAELDAGMKRCQEQLVDMCCVMTIVVDPQGTKAVVTRAEPVTEKDLQALEQRVRDKRK